MTMFESMTSKRKSLGGEATSEKKLKMEPLNEWALPFDHKGVAVAKRKKHSQSPYKYEPFYSAYVGKKCSIEVNAME